MSRSKVEPCSGQNTMPEAQHQTVDVATLKTVLEAQADDDTNMLPDDARVKIHVQYDPKRGKADSLTKSGEVWAIGSGAFTDKIRFSMRIGQDNEDPFFLTTDGDVYSISDHGNENKLGRIKNVQIE